MFERVEVAGERGGLGQNIIAYFQNIYVYICFQSSRSQRNSGVTRSSDPALLQKRPPKG